MFYQVRFQTGELEEVKAEMKKGNIPCMDVIDYEELDWVVKKLEEKGLYKVSGLPYDKNARDAIAEPEFECRVAFSDKPSSANEVPSNNLMYIDFYFDPFVEETYDSCGEM